MQSGIKRKSYDVGACPPETSPGLRNGAKSRERTITGLATDSLNQVVIASTLDGTLNVSRVLHCLLVVADRSILVLRFPNGKIRTHVNFTLGGSLDFTTPR